jgi:DNA-binding PadR family transcriptional regulator
MYRDNTLIPTEAIRLAALGMLAEGKIGYAALAREVRRFVGLMVGPSLDMMGPSLELLCVEGLARADGDISDNPDALLAITVQGRSEFEKLMTSNVRAPVNDVSKLVIALKLRYLHLLDGDHRAAQIEMLSEMCETELSRLEQLQDGAPEGRFADWLAFEIAQLRERVDWFKAQG